MRTPGVGIEDLISIGTIGLIKAVETYKPAKNIKLATYASRCIENEILMHLRKNANRRGEISLDEPLNTDWDGNELLLSDVLGTEGDSIEKPLEDDCRPGSALYGHHKAVGAGAHHHQPHNAIRPAQSGAQPHYLIENNGGRGQARALFSGVA